MYILYIYILCILGKILDTSNIYYKLPIFTNIIYSKSFSTYGKNIQRTLIVLFCRRKPFNVDMAFVASFASL